LEWLREQQTHPDAVKNIVSTLDGNCKTFALAIAVILLAIPLLCVFLGILVLILLPILLFYFICPESAKKLFGVKEESTRNVAEWMLPQRAPADLPAKLRGIFYMRGNPFLDDLTTLERSAWDSEARTTVLPFYQAFTWSVQRSFISFVLMVGSRLICYRYILTFNEDLTEGDIGMYVLCIRIPSFIATFRMTDVSAQQDGSLWERWSLFLGQPVKSYWMEKVVDGVGAKTSYWNHVEKEVYTECWTQARTSSLEVKARENIACNV